MKKIESILEDVRNGIPVLIVDDYDRENEVDVVISATKATYHNILFMMNHAKGLMCIPCTQDVLDRLHIPMMPRNNKDRHGTPFTISVDAVENTTTGMSVNDRLKTISVMTNENSVPDDLAQPGHLFPLRAHPKLLQGRRGHTEGSIELVKLAGLPTISIIVEVMNSDGTMTKGVQVSDFGKVFNLKTISVQEIYDEVYNKSI